MKKMQLVVVDAMDAPYAGRILRLRHQEGPPLTVKGLKGSRFRAVSPGGDERTFRVRSFALFGGRVSDERLARTGRVDVHVVEDEAPGDVPPIGLQWQVRPA